MNGDLFEGIDIDPGARPDRPRQLTIEGHVEEATTKRNRHTVAADVAREASQAVPIAYQPQRGRLGYHPTRKG